MTLKFTKMHGLGNDFMVIDAINQPVDLGSQRIAALANRNFGVGFDQLLLVERPQSQQARFRYRIFNADGGEVAQCGNGARCFARFVREKGLTDESEITVETHTGLLTLKMIDNTRVEVNMGIPRFEPAEIPLEMPERRAVYQLDIEGRPVVFSALSLGNPHAVILTDNVDSAPVHQLGPVLESHPVFPERANVGFIQIISRNEFRLRVFERGSGETQACGSGACAAMVAGNQLGMLDERAQARLTGGELQLGWQGEGRPVMMTGDTAMVYEGEITL